MPLAHLPDGDIHYDQRGAGPALVAILPKSSGPVGVVPFLDALATSFAVIRYDQRGFGGSAPLPAGEAVSIAGSAGHLLGLLDALGIEQADLFGHSTGCGIALALAAAHPERVGRLALANPWSHGDAHLTTMQELRIAAARALDPYRYAWFNASLLFPPEHRRAHQEDFEKMAQAAAPQDAEQIAVWLRAILGFDARAACPSIPHPALVVTAADDQLMAAWHGRELSEILPNARLLELDGGGHMLPETRVDELAAAVRKFFQETNSSTR